MQESKNKRKRVSADIEAEVLFQSDRLCCIDQKRGDHIHHIDGNNSNNEFDNLVLLCFDCHNEASISGSLRKKLTPNTIHKYRDHHYNVIKNKRELSLSKFSNDIEELTTTALINASLTALTLFEISKIQEEYYDCPLNDRDHIIKKLSKLSGNNNSRIAFEVFSFLSKVAYETRNGIPQKMIQTIFSLTIKFFPPPDALKNPTQYFELGFQVISFAFTIIYDSTIHLKDYQITSYGLLILKYIYLKSKKYNLNELVKKVEQTYTEIENQLNRPERNDLEDAKILIRINYEDLKNSDLSFPRLPAEFLIRTKIPN
jgi:hypothetical protein